MTHVRSKQVVPNNLLATESVRRYIRETGMGEEVKRDLLEALGLARPGSRVCEPDDITEHVLVDPGDYSRNLGESKRLEGPDRNLTTPPGLATLQPQQAPSEAPKARKGKPKPAPKVIRPRRERQMKPIEHGTTAGASAHRRRGIPACEPCLAAERRQRRPDAQPAPPPLPHGTTAAWQRHQRHGEKPCEPCRLAKRAAERDRYARNQSAEAKARKAAKAAEEAANAAEWRAQAPRTPAPPVVDWGATAADLAVDVAYWATEVSA